MRAPPVDRAVTVSERGPTGTILPGASGLKGCVQMSIRVNQGVPLKLKHRIPLPHGHGSVTTANEIRGGDIRRFFLE